MINLLVRRVIKKRFRFFQNTTERLRRWVVGFFLGNLIGTFLNLPRSQKIWDGSLIFFFYF